MQVAGLRFEFDPSKPAHARMVPGSVLVAGAPLEEAKLYRLATKLYLAEGKDGYDVLAVGVSPWQF